MAAYEATSFWVDVFPDSPFAIRCGTRTPRLDDLLVKCGASTWAYMTACNPRSDLLTASDNAERMGRLRHHLQQRGYSFFPGEGVPDKPEWAPEPSFLVLGITESEAVSLARIYEQNAILIGTQGQCATLLWVSIVS